MGKDDSEKTEEKLADEIDRGLAVRRSSKVRNKGLAHEGWLEKVGGGSMRKWQKRFFSLRGDILYWYDDERAPTPQKYLQISRTVQAKGPKKERGSDDDPFEFVLKDPSYKQWHLRAESRSVGVAWLKVLSECGASVTPEKYAATDEEREKRRERLKSHIESMKNEGLAGARRRSSAGTAESPDDDSQLTDLAMRALRERRDSAVGVEGAALQAAGGALLSIRVPAIKKGKQIAWTEATTVGDVVEALLPWLKSKMRKSKSKAGLSGDETWLLYFNDKPLDAKQLLKSIGLTDDSELVFQPQQ